MFWVLDVHLSVDYDGLSQMSHEKGCDVTILNDKRNVSQTFCQYFSTKLMRTLYVFSMR